MPPDRHSVAKPEEGDTRVAAAPAIGTRHMAVAPGSTDLVEMLRREDVRPHIRTLQRDPASGGITATVNHDSEECECCRKWFGNAAKYQKHRQRYPIGCEKHEYCMPTEFAYLHAQEHEHERCFVSTCRSRFRYQTGHRAAKVFDHIWDKHYPKDAQR